MDSSPSPSLAHVRPAGVQLSKTEAERDLYRSVVLQLDEEEEQIDKRVFFQALELRIRIPHKNFAILASYPPDGPPPSRSQPSAPEAVTTPSDSSSELQTYQRPSSLTTSIPSVDSAVSVSSDPSNQTKPKRGFQRFAAFRGRKKKAAARATSIPTSPSRRSSSNVIPSDDKARGAEIDAQLEALQEQLDSLRSPHARERMVPLERDGLRRSESIDSNTSYSGAYSS